MIDFNAPENRQNPYPMYAHLRQHEPITQLRSTFGGRTFFVTRYEDVYKVLKDPRFSSDQRQGNAGLVWLDKPWMPRILRAFLNVIVAVDDPKHSRLRNLVHKGFTSKMVEGMAQRIESLSNELLDAAHKNRSAI